MAVVIIVVVLGVFVAGMDCAAVYVSNYVPAKGKPRCQMPLFVCWFACFLAVSWCHWRQTGSEKDVAEETSD
jgi:hypothetical protein